MNPLLLSGFGISIEVDKARLIIRQKDNTIEFYPHRIPYDSLIIDGHYGSISFEAMRWLSKHDVSIVLLNWNGNLLATTLPKETDNGLLRIKQYEKHIDSNTRTQIAEQIVRQKVLLSVRLLEQLSKFYDLDLRTINDEMQRIDFDNINNLMMYEGRIASAYWSEMSKMFNKLAPDFNFQSRKNLSYSWNMNASDQINALLNYGYAILEGMVRKYANTIGLDTSIGYLHEIAPSKSPLVYDLQELFRYVIDYSVIGLLESGLKKSDFITTENYHIRLKPDTAMKLIDTIKDNFNHRYSFRSKQHTLDNIMFENIREFSKYILDNKKSLDFTIPDIDIKRNDTTDVRNRIMSIDSEERKKLKMNKSTLWYQQKKIKEGNIIKVYGKTKVRICKT
jgi:CRISPR-associated protein Cas1